MTENVNYSFVLVRPLLIILHSLSCATIIQEVFILNTYLESGHPQCNPHCTDIPLQIK